MKNTLYYGDNLDVLRRHIADESVDLIYLDPPFKSGSKLQRLVPGTRRQPVGLADSGVRGYVAMGPSGRRRLPGSGGGGRASLAGHASLSHGVGRQRHACLLVDDGPAAERIASGLETDRKHLLALRSHGKPLPENSDGCRVRADAISERDYLETHLCPMDALERYGRVHDTFLFYAKSDDTSLESRAANRTGEISFHKYRHSR